MFKVYPCCSRYYSIMHSQCTQHIHRMDVPDFPYSFVRWWTSGFFCFVLLWIMLLWISVYTFLWTYGFNSCGEQIMRTDMSTATPNNLQAELAQPQPQKGVRAKCTTAAFPKMFTFKECNVTSLWELLLTSLFATVYKRLAGGGQGGCVSFLHQELYT
jgi:hypothetical protein